MATTDHPLKVLVRYFGRDFAEWLLDTVVLSAEPINVELASETLRDCLKRKSQTSEVAEPL